MNPNILIRLRPERTSDTGQNALKPKHKDRKPINDKFYLSLPTVSDFLTSENATRPLLNTNSCATITNPNGCFGLSQHQSLSLRTSNS